MSRQGHQQGAHRNDPQHSLCERCRAAIAQEDTAMYLHDASRALHALAHANGLPVVRHALQAILARATLRRELQTPVNAESNTA